MSRRRQKWSVQLDQYPPTGQKMYGPRTIIESTVEDRSYATNIGLPNNEVDEIFIDGWAHIEAMDDREYWVDIAGVVINVSLDRKGNPTVVTVEFEKRDGVKYQGEAGTD